MKSAKLIVVAIVAVLPLAASLAYGQEKGSAGNAARQIKDLHEQRRMAALRGDASFLEKYLAPDYLGAGVDGRLVTKDQEIQMLKSGTIKYEAIDERDVKVRVYGNAAIVSALASVKLSLNGKPISGDHRATFVWVKQEGNWKLASFQATRVVPMVPRPGNNLGHDARPGPP